MSAAIFWTYLGEVGGVDILQKNASQANDIRLAWDYLWIEFFDKPNVIWTTVVYLASFIVSYCFIAFALSFITGIVSGRLDISLDNLFWLIIVMILLSNNARPVADINLFIRGFTYARVENIYQFSLAGARINEVITDVLVSGETQAEIAQLFSRCNAIGGTEHLECLIEVEERAIEIIDEIEAEYRKFGFDLRGIHRLKKRLEAMSFKEKYDLFNPFENGKEIINPLNIPKLVISTRFILKNIQFVVLNGVELALALTCFYGPIATAASLLPMGTKPLTLWFLGIISLTSLIWSYALCVGIIAMVISVSQTQLQSETAFLIFLALGSPLIAWGLSQGGGAALLQAISSTALFITRTTYGIITGLLNIVF